MGLGRAAGRTQPQVGWQLQQQIPTVQWHNREKKASNAHRRRGFNSAPCTALSLQEISMGDRNSQGVQNAASVTPILLRLSMWGQSPPQVNTDWTQIGLTQPQVSPPTCSHNPATVLKATPVVAGAQAHHPIQHHPSPSSQKSHIPPNLPQPCGIQTCNPGSFSTGVCCTSPLWCCFQEGTNPSQCKGQER